MSSPTKDPMDKSSGRLLPGGTRDQIRLGGTARRPEDVVSLWSAGLQFAEISIKDPLDFGIEAEIYVRLKRELEFYYLCHGPREGNPNDMDALEKVYLPKLLNILPIMTRLEIPLLTVHLWLDSRFVKQDVIGFKIDLLRRVIHAARGKGIIVCIENLSESATDMAFPFDELPELQLTLDIGHAQLLRGQNTSYEFIDHYPERIGHIHLHDNRGGDSPLDDLHLPPGKGIIDFRGIFSALRRMEYRGTMTLELKPNEQRGSIEYVRGLLC